jgi:hypothetical protein
MFDKFMQSQEKGLRVAIIVTNPMYKFFLVHAAYDSEKGGMKWGHPTPRQGLLPPDPASRRRH